MENEQAELVEALLEDFMGASWASEAVSQAVLGYLHRLGTRVGHLEPLMGRLEVSRCPRGRVSRFFGPERVAQVAA